jgi:silicon transporter
LLQTTTKINQTPLLDMVNPCTAFKYAYSTVLLLFSIIMVMALIVNEETKISQDVHPALALLLIWFSVFWLSMVEGGQGPLVGLPPVDRDLYMDSHPITHKCTTLAHKGDNLDRYLIGRQFLVVLIVFVTNLAGAPLKDAEVLDGIPSVIQEIFLGSGVAMILMTAIVGQLTSQVNAAHCMLDYINTYFMLFTLYVSLAIEASGMLHSVYLVQMLFSKLSGKSVVSQEPPRTATQNLFFWFRVVMSLAILGFAFAVTLTALFQGKTTMWEGVPTAVSVILLFVLMSIVGMLEGMQIAFFAVTKLSKGEQAQHSVAVKTYELLFRGGGRNLPGFMIGRQICVTMCFFIIARITTLDVDVDAGDETVFGVSDGLQAFFNTGLLGAIITTIAASIAWKLVASAFPVAFLSNPLVYILLRWCLILEASGICSAAWVLAFIHKRIAGFQVDEVYIGTPEERARVAKSEEVEVELDCEEEFEDDREKEFEEPVIVQTPNEDAWEILA